MTTTKAYRALLGVALAVAACGPSETSGADSVTPEDTVEVDTAGDDADATDDVEDAADTVVARDTTLPDELAVHVTVTLDGAPAVDVLVVQGGTTRSWRTGADGTVEATLDVTTPGALVLAATHPEARSGGATLYRSGLEDAVTIALERYDTADNLAYIFQDPGVPGDSSSTAQCGHCHVSIVKRWYASEHRSAASNPRLGDLYAGRAHGASDAVACAALGGAWREGRVPGGDGDALGCYVGPGVLADLDGACVAGGDCEGTATAFGQCADCHAPGIDGQLGGRDLLEARGNSFANGVHCDICHKVDRVELGAPAGVAGRLRILRPTEHASPSLGKFKPLTFGVNVDVLNPRMGNVPRAHFKSADLCAGCHELEQPALVAGGALDATRWPSGRLPIHTTYSEWAASPMSPGVSCQSCHMPPDPLARNGADIKGGPAAGGVAAGWVRPPGGVREHSWLGPRAESARMLENAAAVFLAPRVEGDTLVVDATTQNVGPGHAIPTGEPLRSIVLVVEAWCEGDALAAVGGDTVPDYGGALAVRERDAGWLVWPEARVGDELRVVARPGGFHDYVGYGPFGDGAFDAAAKGLPVEHAVGRVRALAVAEDGAVTWDGPVPDGDVAYLTRSPTDFAGLPGAAFARVLVGPGGARMVPHHRAVDVASDNRLLPQAKWTSTHRFAATCATSRVEARLLHLDVPAELARAKGWTRTARVMAEVTR